MAGEERVRRNVGEVTTNSRDPRKIVEGSQTSLSKLINEKYGLKTFKIFFYQNIIFIAYRKINPFLKPYLEFLWWNSLKPLNPLKSQNTNKYFYENW